MSYEKARMPDEAAEAVRDLLVLCGARWSGQHGAADDFVKEMGADRLRVLLRWVPPLVAEALDMPAGVTRSTFLRSVSGSTDDWHRGKMELRSPSDDDDRGER